MHDAKEIRRLKDLLTTTRLSNAERSAIEQQITELENVKDPAKLPGVFGVFDRPAPATSQADPPPQPRAAPIEGKSAPTADAEPKQVSEDELEMPPAEAEELAAQIADIADRIAWMQSFWARTLSVEVDREIQMWLAKLQELAQKLPLELAESALGANVGLLTQKPRNLQKETISERLQLCTIAPSAPALDPAGVMTDLYFAIHEPRRPRPPQLPPGHIPDGLQRYV